mmetsp:Transcript_31209/g.99154  ORF Transcript_31209/g.99154 Transcript_31209/m.99154 type:complete len:874 (+) Transcript_31209:2263-4884(+)
MPPVRLDPPLEAIVPWSQRWWKLSFRSPGVYLDAMTEMRDQLTRVVHGDVRGPTRANAQSPVDQQQRDHRDVVTGLHLEPIVGEVLEQSVIFCWKQQAGGLAQASEDVPRAGRVLASLMTASKLTARNEQGQVIRPDEVLRHANDSRMQGGLSVVVRCMFSAVAAQLRHLHVRVQVSSSARVQDLPLTRLEPIYDARDAPHVVCHAEAAELVVHKVLVAHARCCGGKLGIAVGGPWLLREPLAPLLWPLLVEREVDGLIVVGSFVAKVIEVAVKLTKVLPRLRIRVRSETLVVLDLEALLVERRALRLEPLLEVGAGEESLALPLMVHFEQGGAKALQEPRALQQLWPDGRKQVNDEAPNMRSVVVLVRHDHDAAVAHALFCGRLVRRVAGERVQPQDLAEVHNFIDFLQAGFARIPHILQLSTERKYAEVLAAEDLQAGHREGLCRVAFREDERALVAAPATGIMGVLELLDAGQLLGALALEGPRRLSVAAAREFVLDVVDDARGLQKGVQALLRQVAGLRECGRRREQPLFPLRVELRVRDEAIHEDVEAIPYVAGCGLGVEVLALLHDSGHDLLGDAVHVGAAQRRVHAVHEAHGAGAAGAAGREADIPALIDADVRDVSVRCEPARVVLECLAGDLHAIEGDAHAGRRGGGVPDAPLQHGERVLVHEGAPRLYEVLFGGDLVLQPQLLQVGHPGDAREVARLGHGGGGVLPEAAVGHARGAAGLLFVHLGDARLARHAHVVRPAIDEVAVAAGLVGLHLEEAAEDVGKLRAEAVAAAGVALLVVVEVAPRLQLPEDHVGHEHLLTAVHLHRDAPPVVYDADARQAAVQRAAPHGASHGTAIALAGPVRVPWCHCNIHPGRAAATLRVV